MVKTGAFLLVLYLNNFRVFGVLAPQGTKEWFSALKNISLTISSSQRCHKTRKKSYPFYTSFHASRKWLEAGTASGRCNSQGHPMLLISMAGGVSDTRLNYFTGSQPVLRCSCSKRHFGVLGSPNMFWSPLLKVWKIMTSYRNVIFFLSLSLLILNEHSGVDE